MTRRTRIILAVTVLAISFAWSFWRVAAGLVDDWVNDENYSHGFLIVPMALYLAWERREQIRGAAQRPAILGLVAILGSMGLLIVGTLGAEMFLTRVAIIGTLVGCVLFLLGWRHLRILAFPLAFLLLMIPLPALILNQIAFPLQLLASRVGETSLSALRIPVLREGNVIMLANTSLEVAEACSGIRSLVSLLTLALILGYFSDPRPAVRMLIAFASIPVAILANGLRVAGTGVAAHYYGPEAATGFFHTFSGWLVFVAAFAMLLAVQRAFSWIAPPLRAPEAATS